MDFKKKIYSGEWDILLQKKIIKASKSHVFTYYSSFSFEVLSLILNPVLKKPMIDCEFFYFYTITSCILDVIWPP